MEGEEEVSEAGASASANDDSVDDRDREGQRDDSVDNTEGERQESDTEGGREEEEEEQLVASFQDDSRSKDGRDDLGDEVGVDPMNPDNDEDPEQPHPLDAAIDKAFSDANESRKSENDNGEESNDSTSKISNSSKVSGKSPEEQPQESRDDMNLMTDEVLGDEDGDEENLVSEVDVSAMMEVSFDDESQTSVRRDDEEPEVIPIDSDDDNDTTNTEGNGNHESQSQRVFQIDEHENVIEVDASSMVQINLSENEGNDSDSNPPSVASSSGSRRPRRAAAEAAAKIHQISEHEQGIASNVFRHRRKSQEDSVFNPHMAQGDKNHVQTNGTVKVFQQCHTCKKSTVCSIVIRHFGSDLYLCSNPCFSKFRNQGKDCKSKSLPCSKCSLMNNESSSANTSVFFWETMNFCSDLCVGRYQMDVGSQCCTCGKTVTWNSLGKYCVRFGSDIRQFCIPQCLEEYKKNARVCFNCQLDIRRVGNVILANIPSKNTPKEFCSNECVEMYCERNLHQPTRAKTQPEHNCFWCQSRKMVHRELVLSNGNFKVCSESCWQSTLKSKGVIKADKCEMCVKFVNMDLGCSTPVYWISTMNRVFGFCSHVCKNLFILSNRKIMACASCKVKKYNYDLIEHFSNSSSAYAVCSLACIPKPADYLKNIRSVLYLPQITSDNTTPSAVSMGKSSGSLVRTDSGAATTYPSARNKNNQSSLSLTNGDLSTNNNDDSSMSDIQIGPTDNILDILTMEEIEALVEEIQKRRPQTRSVMCSATPKTRSIETQTDISELNAMRMFPLSASASSETQSDSSNVTSTEKTVSGGNEVENVDSSKEISESDKSSKENPTEPSGSGTRSGVHRRRSSEKDNDECNKRPRLDTGLQSQSVPKPELPSSYLSSTANTPLQASSSCSNLSSISSPSLGNSPRASSVEPSHPIISHIHPTSSIIGGACNDPAPSAMMHYMNTGGAPASSISSPTLAHPASPLGAVPGSLGYATYSHTLPTSLGYNRPLPPVSAIVPLQHTAPNNRVEHALRAWRIMFGPTSDPRSVTAAELSYKFCELVSRGCSPDGRKYRPDGLLYISLGIQQLLSQSKRVDRIFYDNIYYNYVVALTDMAERENTTGLLSPTIDENNFWETYELGASSPGVLLFSLIYLFKKHFGLKTWEMQSALQFSHVVLQSRYEYGKYVKYLSIIGLPGAFPVEVPENNNQPERCFVRMYEFYCYKSANRDGPFYKCLRQDYTPRSPWFTPERLHQRHVYQMLLRALMIKSDGFS